MTTTTDSRAMAAARLAELIAAMKGVSGETSAPLIEECEALARAIDAFHM